MSSRMEDLITALLNGEDVEFTPQSRLEQYLKNCLDGSGVEGLPTPISRVDVLLYQLADKMTGGGVVPADDTQAYMLVTPDGEEIPAVLVSEETLFTGTANDVREGVTVASEDGVITGTKVIPSYNTTEGAKYIPAGSSFVLSSLDKTLELYDFTKLQAMVCPYNGSISASVAVEKVAINEGVYSTNSTDVIATVIKDNETKSIDLGIVNDSGVPYILRYFTFKEIY